MTVEGGGVKLIVDQRGINPQVMFYLHSYAPFTNWCDTFVSVC